MKIRILAALVVLAICSTAYAAQQTFSDGEANSSVRSKINANAGEVTNIQTLSGVAAGAVNLGGFTGSLLSDTLTVKAAFQAVETAIELYPATCTNDEDTVEWDTTTNRFVCKTLPTLDVDADADGLVDKVDISTAGILKASAAGALSVFVPATGVETLLTTPTSANLRAAITDESGTGALLFAGGNIGSATSDGAVDFGGATSFEAPNGASPTVDAAGEIGIDTTSDQFIFYGGAKRVVSYKDSENFAVKTPVDADDFLLFKAQQAITITDIHVIAQGGTSISVNIQECNSSGASCSTVDAAITADTDGAEDDGTLSNGTIDAGDWVKVVLGAPSGTVNYLAGSIYYTITAD